jgi:hypothetical protein
MLEVGGPENLNKFGREHDHFFGDRMRARHMLELAHYCDDSFTLATLKCALSSAGEFVLSPRLDIDPLAPGVMPPQTLTVDPERLDLARAWFATAMAAIRIDRPDIPAPARMVPLCDGDV